MRARVIVALDLLCWLDQRSQDLRDLLAEREHIHQLDRCLADQAMPLDLPVGAALVLLFGMLASRIAQLTKDDVIDDNRATWLAIGGYRLMLPARLARLVRQPGATPPASHWLPNFPPRSSLT